VVAYAFLTAVAYVAAYLVAGAWLVVCLADWLR